MVEQIRFVAAGSLFEAIEGHFDAVHRVERLLELSWSTPEAPILAGCWLRMATMLGHAQATEIGLRHALAIGCDDQKLAVVSRAATDPRFGVDEHAAIMLAEQIVVDAGGVSEFMIERLKRVCGDAAAFRLVASIAIFDQCLRLSLTSRQLVGSGSS